MTFILNFHGIGPCSRPFEEGEEPYWISEKQFRICLDMVEQSGREILLTFDDGNVSDHDVALPELKKRKVSATFFVLAGRIGKTGYLSERQIRNISSTPGMQIGSHGMDHLPWPDVDSMILERELRNSQQILSDVCGLQIVRTALPFGRYNRRVLKKLHSHGYRDVFSSDGREKLTQNNPVPRYSVRADVDFRLLENYLAKPPRPFQRVKNELRALVKSRI